MFNKFKGIRKEREITVEDNNLGKLIKLADEILKNPPRKDLLENSTGYSLMLDATEKLVKEIDFNADDLSAFVLAKANSDLEKPYILGAYTGCLLEILTKRNNEKKDKTRIHINGQGNRFDCLFSFTGNVDELILENFTGKNICSGIGHAGKVGLVYCKNIKGDGVLRDAGYGSKNMGVMIAQNIQGELTLSHCSYGGYTKLILASDIKGEGTIEYCATTSGRIGVVIAQDIEGDDTLQIAGHDNGCIGLLAARNIKGDSVLSSISQFGYIGVLFAKDIEGRHALGALNFNEKSVDHAFIENARGEGVLWGSHNKTLYETNPKKYRQKIRKYRLNVIQRLMDSLKGKGIDETVEITNKIYAQYNMIRKRI